MGAYYQATVKIGNRKPIRFSTWSINQGSKLMEHSYLNNGYVNAVLNYIGKDRKFRLTWLCDYHEGEMNWDIVKEVEFNNDWSSDFYGSEIPYTDYIINHTQKTYIDIAKLYILMRGTEWKIHPLPILTNSDKYSMGGGDYHEEDSRRGIWESRDLLELKTTTSKKYNDITEDCIFKED